MHDAEVFRTPFVQTHGSLVRKDGVEIGQPKRFDESYVSDWMSVVVLANVRSIFHTVQLFLSLLNYSYFCLLY